MVPGQAPLVDKIKSVGVAGTWTDLNSPALLLRTSGSTSKPKVVPLNLRGLLTGSTCIGQGLGLRTTDQCLSVMPFTHIGGISCNLLGSLMAGSSVRCTPGFDPARFLSWVEEFQPTWYQAVPTVHVAVVLACNGKAPKHSFRFIRSGAANLTHADAVAMKELWGCPIYPTYSMTECMPIVQPLQTYNLDKPGSCGVPIASSLRIVGGNGCKAVASSENGKVRGEVCVSGPVVTPAYLDSADANEKDFFEDEGKRWFRTGDIGYMDSDGYVFLTGRSKELIKRGGEQVSPYEVEEALMKHPAVQVAVVFAVPNDFWGEEVAAAVVLKPQFSERGEERGAADAKLARVASLRKSQSQSSMAQTALNKAGPGTFNGTVVNGQDIIVFAAAVLPDFKVPRQVKFVTDDQLPKTGTKKYQRVGLWEELGLQAVDLKAQEAARMATGTEPIVGAATVADPVEVNPALLGVRVFFAINVIFVHVGDWPAWIGIWRSLALNMQIFFTMAGFMLEKATTRPITDPRKFFRSRIMA